MQNITYVMSEFSNEEKSRVTSSFRDGRHFLEVTKHGPCVSACVRVRASAYVRAGFGLLFPTCGGAMQNYYVLLIKQSYLSSISFLAGG